MIGDLLAQISGGASTAPTPKTQPPPKRKADSDSPHAHVSKTPRTESANGGPTSSSLASRPISSRPTMPSSSSARPTGGPVRTPTLPSMQQRIGKPASGPTSANATADSKVPPKKGSYAEIMARARAAQAAMGQVGKIQHKPVEKGPSKRERMIAQADDARQAKDRSRKPAATAARPAMVRSSMTKPLSGSRTARSALNGASGRPSAQGADAKKERTAANGRSKASGRKAAAEEEEKRPKKAATATTGYQGTARPRPTSSSSANAPGHSSGAAGDRPRTTDRPRMPFGAPRRSRYDEDDEMDDFIEYDDEEEDTDPGRYGGAARRREFSDDEDGYEDESDMEAGISDIDEEEERAEHVARREDAQQEALERRLKAEKERRKRQAMASGYRR